LQVSSPSSVPSSLEWLSSLLPRGMVFGLGPTEEALAAVGDPHRACATLHVAGTNGKGSTSAFAAAMLAAQGRRVGLYTSPHLQRLNERMVMLEPGDLRRREISDGELAELAALVRQRGPDGLTFFEATTVMAFEHFRRRGAEVVVLETGLGGRLDSTNVCAPLACAITNVALEHQEILGPTVARIAAEKAGIIKRGVPLVTAAADPEARSLIAARASELSAALHVLGEDLLMRPGTGGAFAYAGPGGPLEVPALGLAGLHQRVNASLALALLGVAGLRPAGAEADRACQRALAEVDWPGRLQTLRAKPHLIIDAAHNPAAAAVLARALQDGPLSALRARGGRSRLVFGVLTDKDVAPMLAVLAPLFDAITLVRPRGPRGRDPGSYRELVAAASATSAPVELAGELAAALPSVLAAAAPEDLVVVTGSCLLAGETLDVLPELPGAAEA
jgi:dihydrofolate synthase/folylpolyglutamate synthase